MFGLLIPKGAFRYAIMPEIGVRFSRLFMSGFHYIPFFIAIVYQMVGLLPRHHPYLNQSNLGRYGIRHVVFEASSNIKFSLKNIDQIILFIAVLIGLIIFLVQILSLGAFAFFQPAMAAMPTNWAGFFSLVGTDASGVAYDYRAQDLASMMLDMVFGVPYPDGSVMGFFESCVGSSVTCQGNSGDIADMSTMSMLPSSVTAQLGPLSSGSYNNFPFPYHLGMHRLFAVYSNGLLVIAVMITSYFVVTVLAETAQTGTPFGKRFNKTWTPLRIVVAFGLLMPLNVGLNSSQYLVLYAAKYGSAFASNGWRMFNETLTGGYLGDNQDLVTVPNVPDLSQLTKFMYVARVCKVVNDFYEFQAQFANDLRMGNPPSPTLHEDNTTHMYMLWKKHSDPNNTWRVPSTGQYAVLIAGLDPEFTSVDIVFGTKNSSNTDDSHGVYSSCGKINLVLTDPRQVIGPDSAEAGLVIIQKAYFDIILSLWHTGYGIILSNPPTPPEVPSLNHRHVEFANRATKGLSKDISHSFELNAEYVQNTNDSVSDYLKTEVISAAATHGASNRLQDSVRASLPILYSKGWAAAGLWYNRVAEMNGSLMSATYAVPAIVKYPKIQEQVGSIKNKYDKEIDEKDARKPEATGIGSMSSLLKGSQGMEFATTLYRAEVEWSASGLTKEEPTGNAILDAISSLLGLNGLYDMRNNPNAHPLAMLVGIGRSLVDSAINSLGYAAMSSVFAASGVATSLAVVSGSFFVSIAMMGLTVGFVLFYVIPFLPFIYFFFAVGGWVKGIFEAMVGAPLWALAHIRIDGHGLSGSAAVSGYFLIFEIFLRPILIVFGLLASISIFSALVSVLNIIFETVTSNVGGFDMATEMDPATTTSVLQYSKSRIDQFFFTIIYAVIVYMIGMSSFKLIDTIPNNILRWMGQSVATFGDQRENPAEGLVSKATVGSQQSLSKIGGGMQQAVQGAGAVGK